MGIDSIPTNQTNQLVTSRNGSTVSEARGDAEKLREAAGNSKTQDDTLTLSKMASILSSSVEGQAFGEVVNQQLVDQIRTAIESGNYKVKSEDVAQKFLDFEVEL